MVIDLPDSFEQIIGNPYFKPNFSGDLSLEPTQVLIRKRTKGWNGSIRHLTITIYESAENQCDKRYCLSWCNFDSPNGHCKSPKQYNLGGKWSLLAGLKKHQYH